MKVILNRDACIGCGACAAIAEDVFDSDNEGISVLKKEEVSTEEEISVVQDAVDSCPTGAIALEEDEEK